MMNSLEHGSKRPFSARPPLSDTDIVSIFRKMHIVNALRMESVQKMESMRRRDAAKEKKVEEIPIQCVETMGSRALVRSPSVQMSPKELWNKKRLEREERAAKRARDREMGPCNLSVQDIQSNPWTQWTTPPLGL
ncbi:hypothetical protein HI914_03956 [Erysiphe necator]|uniref:Uncharacterized protein n=1 Tax=Uncinula necator TaxID=52586 RepID=A0A0B1P5H5_UNCNE|nr:hypothetical protein HI914_03956 [Erysiphe necator]KHJ33528.1 hypothetical protein EV44_g4815 [Erysiphe necator]